VTSDDTTSEQAGSVSGADLARMALQSARAAAKSRGNAPVKAKPKRATVVRTGGREPIGFGSVLGSLAAEGAWAAPVAGGSVVANWAQIAPAGVADHLAAVRFDADSGRLEVRPDSAAYATLARLNSADLLRRIAEHTGTDAVRHIRVLAPGPLPAPRPPAPRPAPGPGTERPAPPPGPVRTREDASPGYHQARAALMAGRPGKAPAAPVREAIDRQTRAVLEHREPESAFTPAADRKAELREREEHRRSGDVQQRALRRARTEHAAAQLPSITPKAAPGPLERSA
jgi:predicted nucleic acid-binding Zn ribbon protein